jgi:hypothetical protein
MEGSTNAEEEWEMDGTLMLLAPLSACPSTLHRVTIVYKFGFVFVPLASKS